MNLCENSQGLVGKILLENSAVLCCRLYNDPFLRNVDLNNVEIYTIFAFIAVMQCVSPLPHVAVRALQNRWTSRDAYLVSGRGQPRLLKLVPESLVRMKLRPSTVGVTMLLR